jgi:hypothetical protein
LYGIVRDHFETFRAHAASLRDGEGLPRFVEQAFRDFLRCGWLAGGFAISLRALWISNCFVWKMANEWQGRALIEQD